MHPRTYCNFNSTKVRLKVRPPRQNDGDIPLFQFHKGSIKRALKEFEHCVKNQFQFHKGSIKRTMSPHCRGRCTYFNSTKVRLKVEIQMKEPDEPTLFQFHKGSIKSDGLRLPARCRSRFQFHKGSIKRPLHDTVTLVDSVISIPQRFD